MLLSKLIFIIAQSNVNQIRKAESVERAAINCTYALHYTPSALREMRHVEYGKTKPIYWVEKFFAHLLYSMNSTATTLTSSGCVMSSENSCASDKTFSTKSPTPSLILFWIIL